MDKQNKYRIGIISIVLVLIVLIIIIIYNVLLRKPLAIAPPDNNPVTNFEGTQINKDNVVDGDVDTIDEYKYMLESAHGKKGYTFEFVSETDTTIMFNLVNNSNKTIFEIYEMNKKTLEVSVSVPKEDSE